MQFRLTATTRTLLTPVRHGAAKSQAMHHAPTLSPCTVSRLRKRRIRRARGRAGAHARGQVQAKKAHPAHVRRFHLEQHFLVVDQRYWCPLRVWPGRAAPVCPCPRASQSPSHSKIPRCRSPCCSRLARAQARSGSGCTQARAQTSPWTSKASARSTPGCRTERASRRLALTWTTAWLARQERWAATGCGRTCRCGSRDVGVGSGPR